MSISENKRIVRAWNDLANRGAVEEALRLFAEDVTWMSSGTTRFSGTFTGKRDLVERLVQPLFGQLKSGIRGTINNLVAEGDWVVAEMGGEAETKGGKPYNNAYCFLFRIRDGKIAEVREYMDTDLVNRVFGQ